jgi:predicted DNA-binding protein (MmcQ/YjbR family)
MASFAVCCNPPENEMTPDEAWNPYFRALWEHCRAKPDAVEDHPWGETVFKVRGKCFAFLGLPEGAAVTVKPDADDLDAMLALPFVERAAYIGRYGWVKVRIEDDDALALALELVDQTYEAIAPRGKRNHRDTA